MAVAAIIAVALAGQGVAAAGEAPEATYQVGYEQLVDGNNRAAIETIQANEEIANDDPARLINLGIALARTGDFDAARRHFEAARDHEERFELETASGDWVDSRTLARKGLAMLERGEFQRYFALSMR